MHATTTDILLVIAIAIGAVALVGQWLALISVARKLSALADKLTPMLPAMEKSARALPGMVADAQALIADVRPKLQTVAANLAEISTLARDQVKRADQFATDFGSRLELQMIRVDEGLGAALASIEEISTAVRETVLRPVRDVNAILQGVRTGLDFFFRRRPGPPSSPIYQDEEMFI